MLTETLSGKCPNCGYDKLLQRYGSFGYLQLDGCSNCGFGYATNHCDGESFGIQSWISYGKHILASQFEDYDAVFNELDQLDDESLRFRIFEWCESQPHYDDVEETVFKYTDEDIELHRSFGIRVFKEIID